MTTASDAPQRARQKDLMDDHKNTIMHLSGQVKNTVKDMVSVLKGYYQGAETRGDPGLLQKTQEPENGPEYWKDWRWQVRHWVRDIDTFMAFVSGMSLKWENVSDSTARAFIRDNDLCAEALVHFDGTGRIHNIEACHRNHSETGRPLPGHFMHNFSDYTDMQGYKIPRQISSELILPEGKYANIEFTITSIEFERGLS